MQTQSISKESWPNFGIVLPILIFLNLTWSWCLDFILFFKFPFSLLVYLSYDKFIFALFEINLKQLTKIQYQWRSSELRDM